MKKYGISTPNERTCLMYYAACKVEFQPFTRSNSQLTFFNFLLYIEQNTTRLPPENSFGALAP